jgi:hypothetical protein
LLFSTAEGLAGNSKFDIDRFVFSPRFTSTGKGAKHRKITRGGENNYIIPGIASRIVRRAQAAGVNSYGAIFFGWGKRDYDTEIHEGLHSIDGRLRGFFNDDIYIQLNGWDIWFEYRLDRYWNVDGY